MKLILSLLLAAVTSLTTAAGLADTSASEEAFQKGAALFGEGHYREAAASFREAYDAHPDWKILYNIGHSEARARHFGPAVVAFEKYLDDGGDAIPAARRQEVASMLTKLQGKLAFQEGTAMFEQEKYAAAALKFRRAYEINPNWKVFYNIAQSEAAAGHHGRALEAFEKYLALGADNIDGARQKEVEVELDRLQRLVGYVAVTAPPGAVIYVDDVARGTAPLPGKVMIVASVMHELKVVFEGQELERRKIKVNGRQSIAVAVNAKRTGQGEDTPVAEQTHPVEEVTVTSITHEPKAVKPTKRQKQLRPISIALMATGGASLAASLVTGGIAFKRHKDLKKPCSDGGCLSDDYEKNDSIDALAKASNVLLISGVVVAAAGTALFFIDRKQRRTERLNAFTPAVGPNTAGVLVTGRF